MTTKFEMTVIDNLNKFRENPQSIIHSVEVYRKGLSRIKSKDPLLGEIDKYLLVLQKMKPMPKLNLNTELTNIAREQARKFSLNPDYQLYQKGNELKGILPDYYLTENPSLLADVGADDPNNQIIKLLLNKIDKKKKGRSFITDSFYTQVGIGLQIFEEENYIVLIFANEEKNYVPPVEKKIIISNDEMTELKQAFDLFDFNNDQTIKIKDAMEAMKYMNFDTQNPELYKILDELSLDNEIVSWDKFSSHVNERLTNYNDENGLRTIFNLCIDNPKDETITFETFKRICNEIGENMSDAQMKHIMKNATQKGDQITFEEFCEYIKA